MDAINEVAQWLFIALLVLGLTPSFITWLEKFSKKIKEDGKEGNG
jgi:hypothetical protein